MVVRQPRRRGVCRAGGDDGAVEIKRAPVAKPHLPRRDKRRRVLNNPDFARARKRRKPAAQAPDEVVLEGGDSPRVNLRLAEGDAVPVQRLRLARDRRQMQQRFRRDAADIQANAA